MRLVLVATLLSLVSCKMQENDLAGCWISRDLDFFCFDGDSCTVGFTHSFRQYQGKVIKTESNQLGLEMPSDLCPGYNCDLEFEAEMFRDSMRLHPINESSKKYNRSFGIDMLYRAEYLLSPHPWDSLQLEFYVPIDGASSFRLVEKFHLHKNGELLREVFEMDDTRKLRFYKLKGAKFEKISTDISLVDPQFYELMQAEVADDYFNVLKIYRYQTTEQYHGYDFPSYFISLKNFFRYEYVDLDYVELD